MKTTFLFRNILTYKIVKTGLIVSFLSFFWTTKAIAEVDINVLNSVVKSCQENPPKATSNNVSNEYECIVSRYYYTVYILKFNYLKNLGILRDGFPGSVIIARFSYMDVDPKEFLDCIISQDVSSGECMNMFINGNDSNFILSLCPSCLDNYVSLQNSPIDRIKSIAKDLINWFYKLDKPSRKLVVKSLPDRNDTFAKELRIDSANAVELYRILKEKVETENQEQRRRNLLQ